MEMTSFFSFAVLSLFFVLIGTSPVWSVRDSTLPTGITNHGNPKLICVPTKWYHILEFFAFNYVAHAATVKSVPGQKFHQALFDVLFALAFPFHSVSRALESLACWSFR